MQNLQDLYFHKLQMAYDVESQLTDAILTLSTKSTDRDLTEALQSHLEETKEQHVKISELLDKHRIAPSIELSFLANMISHTEEMIEASTSAAVIDAIIIAEAQAAEHLEMAMYGTLIAWADELEFDEDKKVLESILSQEKSADDKLSGIAEGGFFTRSVNETAAATL